MSSKKKESLVKYCRIFQWIEAQDSEFAGAIRDLCLEGALAPSGHMAGITFLYPKDKTYRQEVINLTYSEKADDAVRIVESLIMPDALINSSDFTNRPVGSKLGVKYNVLSTGSGSVKLAGGVELVLASDFSTLSNRTNRLVIWNITSGRLPTSGESYKAPTVKPHSKRGGSEKVQALVSPEGMNARQKLANSTEFAYNECMIKDKCLTTNPYLANVVSLLNFLKKNYPDEYVKVLPIIDYNPVVTFYLLLEPYKYPNTPDSEYLIKTSALFGNNGWNQVNAFTDAIFEYKEMFISMSKIDEKSASDSKGKEVVPYVFSNQNKVADEVQQIRDTINEIKNGRQLPNEVQTVYDTLIKKNSILTVCPVLPNSTQKALPGCKKLWQDEFRFIMHHRLQEFVVQGEYNRSAFQSFVDTLRFTFTGNNYNTEICLSNPLELKDNVDPKQDMLSLLKFINSTDFLYTPYAVIGKVGGDSGSMDPTDDRLYHRSAYAARSLDKTKTRNEKGISTKAFQELQVYVQINGTLPPAVVALMTS